MAARNHLATNHPVGDYLDKETTTCVNGIFILVVFLSHIQSYITLPSGFLVFTKAFGQLMVAMFLFYSGYGVGISIRNKGMDYVRNIPRRRVAKVFLQLIPAVLIYTVIDLICGIPFTAYKFIFSLLAWENMGNSNWYIFVILWLYIFTWGGFMLADAGRRMIEKQSVRDREDVSFALVMLLTGFLVIFLHETRENYWYNTISAYFLGMLIAFRKEKWMDFLDVPVFYYGLTVISLAVTLLIRPYRGHASVFLLMTVTYCIFVLCLTKKIPVRCRALYWIGSHLFEIYILMRIPMMLLMRFMWPHWQNWPVFLVVSLSGTFSLAMLYSKFCKNIEGVLTERQRSDYNKSTCKK